MKIQLSTFIVVSCLVHASLLLWVVYPPAPQVHIGGHAASLQITLAVPPAPGPVAKQAAARQAVRPAPPAAHQHPQTIKAAQATPQRQPPARPSDQQHGGRATAPVATAAETSTAPVRTVQQSSSLSVSERVSAALQSQLAERFEYPWLARKRGWQGQLTLSLHIDHTGAVSQWRVARTSGHNVLDRSALKAARQIDRLPQADQLLDGKSLNLSIPVRYQLTDS